MLRWLESSSSCQMFPYLARNGNDSFCRSTILEISSFVVFLTLTPVWWGCNELEVKIHTAIDILGL
jgi:hypothetical protein